MFLLVDFISPQGVRAFTTRLDKIEKNVTLMKLLKANIEKQKQSAKEAFSTLTVFGRWLVVYQANVANDENTVMHFIDFRIDLTDYKQDEVFSSNTIKNLITLQTRYDAVFTNNMNTVELTLAEPFETVLREGLFTCDNDKIVIAKAKELGVFPMIETLVGEDKVKVTIADEIKLVDEEPIKNVYAFIHFGGTDSGFAYCKIYDLLNNLDKIDLFVSAIEAAGGRFDRTILMERFDQRKLN